MKKRYKFLFGWLFVGYWVGCAPVNFEKDVSGQCSGHTGCVYNPSQGRVFDQSKKIDGGKVDILFVNDNSGSMSFEQNQVAYRFNNFVQSLDNRSVDYRIGIITTDVSATANNGPRSINGNGALQDGKLIEFAPGLSFITRDTPSTQVAGVWKSKEQMFADTIQRKETQQCESFLNSNPTVGQSSSTYLENCPSPDERGIFAANLLVESNPSGFIRSNAHLAIVFLSDEDVRSSLYYKVANYSLQAKDLPQNLIASIQSRFPTKGLSIHSLIVRPGALSAGSAEQVAQQLESGVSPVGLFSGGDVGCLNQQGSQTVGVSGSYGYLYALATRMTNGIEGNICASDYTSELQNISLNIAERVNQFNLACSNPTQLEVFLDGFQFSQWTRNGSSINFTTDLPVGSTLRVKYTCPAI